MLKILDFFGRIINLFLHRDYWFIGPGYGEYWYREGKRKARIHFEYLDPSGEVSMVVYMSSVKNWMSPHESQSIDNKKRAEIAERFRNYLDKDGEPYKMQ